MTKIYILENSNYKIKVSSLGGTILSFVRKKDNLDIVLGYKTIEEYPNNGEYFGATIGRCANRIGKGQFELNGTTYHLDINNGPNSLHGGNACFAFKEFDEAKVFDDLLILNCFSKDQEGGYPGNLLLTISYQLNEDGLTISYVGQCDKDTLMNITNHSYFNLGDKDILNHEMMIQTNKVNQSDEDVMAKEDSIDVEGTSFDFREYRKIGDNLKLQHKNLSNGGIDHNYIFESLDDKLVASLRYNHNILDIYSTMPDVQIYTANFFEHVNGKKVYEKFAGVAIEPQYVPNAINYTKYLKPILSKGKIQEYQIRYVLRES